MTIAEAYLKMQEDCGIKVGDKVKVLRKAESWEMGWSVSWTNLMDDLIGKIGEVEEKGLKGFLVRFDNDGCWWFPFFVLEKIEGKEEYYCIGDRFIKGDEIFVLMVDDMSCVGLFSLKSFHCYNDCVEVYSFYKITSKELYELSGDGFKLIEKSPLRKEN